MADARETLWVLRAQVGARDAFDSLFRAVQAPLHRTIAGLVGDAALADDILQEVFLLVYRKIAHLREPELFRPWCFRIAARETFRRLKREREWTAMLGDDGALETVEARAEPPAPELLALIGQVSPASRAVLLLHYEGGLTLEETAEALGIPVGTAKSRLAHGLAQLRRWAGEG